APLSASRPGRRQSAGYIKLAANLGLLRSVPAHFRDAAGYRTRGRCQHAVDRRAGLPRPRRVRRRLYLVELCHTPPSGWPHELVGLLDRTLWCDAVSAPPWDRGQHLGCACPGSRGGRSGPPIAGAVDQKEPELVQTTTAPRTLPGQVAFRCRDALTILLNAAGARIAGGPTVRAKGISLRASISLIMALPRDRTQPWLGCMVLNDCHVNLSSAAQNTCGLDATNAHGEACPPILKLTEKLPCLRAPGIGQQNPATWSERTVQYGSDRAIESRVIEDIGAEDHIKRGWLDPIAPVRP